MARRIGLPAHPLLGRIGGAIDQTSLSAAERWVNLEAAFTAGPCWEPVLVVDDLVTTGSTLRSCATALVEAGSPRVDALVACNAQAR